MLHKYEFLVLVVVFNFFRLFFIF